MKHRNKILTLFALVAFVVAGAASINGTKKTGRNLKVLPIDISDTRLDSFMHVYTKALGEDCKFCHAPAASLRFGETNLDFESDSNPMKNNARDMMKMVIDINGRYFRYDSTKAPVYLTTISCMNCHRGSAVPPPQ